MGLAIMGHGVLAAALVPGLAPLWLSERVARAMAEARLQPRQGMAPPPVAVAGYAEPSLVFALGTPTDLGDAPEAALAIATFRPAVVEAAQEAAFRRLLDARGLTVRQVREVRGLNYSHGAPVLLRIYVNAEPRPAQPRALPPTEAAP